jgi:Domain of unknown function (DUF4180)
VELTFGERPGLRCLEGSAEQQLLHSIRDAELLVEACLSGGVDCALLYAANVGRGFFDLSSGQAGAILRKLRSYGIRLAVVCVPGTAQLSSRFGELLAEEERSNRFRLFVSREAALEWLSGAESSTAVVQRGCPSGC